MKKIALLLALISIIAWGCSSDNGELVGVKDRPVNEDLDLRGMKFIEQGSYVMGTGDQDQPYSYSFQPKTVQVSAFFMDETEIRNNEYRQFVYWVRDSIAHRLLGEANDQNGHLITEDEFGEPLDNPVIDWDQEIDWNTTDEEERDALLPLYIPVNERYHGKKEIDSRKLNYEYYWIDYTAAAAKENVANVNTEYRGSAYSNRPKGLRDRSQFIRKEVINIYPDTLCWVFDYAYSYNEDQTRMYFAHPAYDDYPVVGVSWKQARAFCHWRTQLLNNYLGSRGYTFMSDFRLPLESEWEYAARGGIALSPYPWGGPYNKNGRTCFLSNHKPGRGNYSSDGGSYTLVVAHYAPNDFGLYDMAGNVAEWCEDAFEKSTYTYGHDFKQANIYNAKDDDKSVLKLKVIRGGSWKDEKFYTQVHARTYEYQDSGKSYIGFRCVQGYNGRNKGDNLKSASNVAE